MLQAIWGGMMLLSIVFALITGRADQILPSALSGASEAVALTLKLAAGYLFFCGMVQIAKALQVPQKLGKALSPLMRRLFPSIRNQETKNAIVLNFAANILGLGNAATPMGMEAMERMEAERGQNPAMLHAMYLFLVINATSLQLVPTTVIALRVAAGSASPTSILLPTIACTAVSTLAGTLCALFCAKRRNHANP